MCSYFVAKTFQHVLFYIDDHFFIINQKNMF